METKQRRILVGHAPIRTGVGQRPLFVPHRVAVLPWRAPFPLLSIIVKAAVSYRGEGPFRRAVYVPGASFVAGSNPDADRPRGDDFIANKKLCDVLVTGHVELVPLPSGEVPVRHGVVRAGDRSVSFAVHGAGAGRVPLRPPYLQSVGASETRLGPSLSFDGQSVGDYHDEEFDFAQYQAANPALQLEELGSGSVLVLEGFNESGARLEIQLPGLFARAIVEAARENVRIDAELFLDTVHIDVDEEVMELTFRGFLPASEVWRQDLDHIVVGFASDEQWAEEDDEARFTPILRELSHGQFSNAWERDDVLQGKEPPKLADEELEMARYDALDFPLGPEATLTLEEHANIAAQLMEEREPRVDLLGRYDLDEFRWALEERALGEQLMAHPTEGSEPAQDAYARHFCAAQSALKREEEDRLTARDFAEIKVRIEVENPREVLRDIGFSLGMWMRIDRSFSERMGRDQALAEEIQVHLQRERETRGERQELVVDEQGRIVS